VTRPWLFLMAAFGCKSEPPAHSHDMPHRFDDAERWATAFDDPSRDAWQQPDRVIAALSLTPEMTVADVGAGTGYFTVRLARALPAGRVVATDVEPDMMRYLEARARREGLSNIETIVTPHDDPMLSRVDRVLVVDVWHHLDGRVAFAKKLAAALEPGGLIVIVDYKLDASRGPPLEHRLAPATIATELRAAGLDVDPPIELQQQYVLVAR
jgi:cyclopropane fatty-acyl-phospholipid synthase-like methyltransferase